MKNNITDRQELLLAKIAGENVSLSTMTPPVAMNKKEKLLLDIADRLSGFDTGGGGDSGVGGGGVMIVTLTEDDGSWVADKTAEEIFTSAQTKEVAAVIVKSDELVALPLTDAFEDKGDYYAKFGAVTTSNIGTCAIFAFIDDQKIDVDTIPLVQGPLAITGTIGQDANQHDTLTTDLTAEELYEAAEFGRLAKISFAAIGDNRFIDCVCSFAAVKNDFNGVVSYLFRVDTDKTYIANGLSAKDFVVFTAV